MHAFTKLVLCPNGHSLMRRAFTSSATQLGALPALTATTQWGSTQPTTAEHLPYSLLTYRSLAGSSLHPSSSQHTSPWNGHSVPFSTSPIQEAPSPAPVAPAQPAGPSISPLQAAVPAAVPRPPSQQKGAIKEATCHYRNVQGSIKKFNIVLKVVRRLQIDDAIAQCDLAKKRAAQRIKKALINALSNALYQKDMNREDVIVDEIYVTKGQYQKKMMAMGRGFSGTLQKRFCHVKIVLREAPEKVRHRTRFVEPIMMRTLKHRGIASSSEVKQSAPFAR